MARPDPNRPGDPVRLVGLLWTPSAASGRSGVTVRAVTEAAIRLADAEGLGAVTMRRLADELGVGAMTLYTYVPGRTELVELMLDRVSGEVYADGQRPGDAPHWREGMGRVVDANWASLRAHPWTVDVPPGRPVLGPGVSTKYELELAPLDGIGLSDVEMNHVLSAVVGLVAHAARWYLTLDRVRTDTALTDEQWWQVVAPSLGAAMAASGATFPLAGRVGAAVGEALDAADDPEGSMRYAVDRLLDGVAARLAR
jgi:AcrR family transcriptional regulator